MYAYIKGTLEVKSSNYVVVENNDIGYKVFMSSKSIGTIGEIGSKVKVHIHYHVREDNISLYGFNTEEELRMFEILINVSGIGTKSAIAMLSDITPASFAIAVINDDVTRLTRIPGVGKKTAQRLILELKDKLKTADIASDDEEESNVSSTKEIDLDSDAATALKVLGYSKKEIEYAFSKINTKGLETEEVIKKALNFLGR